ncbi:MAG: DNRLRE domain-containing protein, partial [Actinomycetota bacterium]|nr:DNRLRE domain-containing protein [Actinomycetota bacterium]
MALAVSAALAASQLAALPSAAEAPGASAAEAPATSAAPAPPPEERELPELRTRTSATYSLRDGSYRAEISTGSRHYRDAAGAWQRIDDTLVPADKAGVAAKNRANRYTAEFPTDIATGEVRVTTGDAWAAFAPEGLAAATAQVAGNAVRYAGVRPGVDLLYEVGHDAVKESFILASPAAASSFSFLLRSSPGLRAAVRGQGVDLRDAAGDLQLRVNPPELIDATGRRGPVRLDAEPVAGGMRLTLTGDRAWLEAPERTWPVVLDPTTTVGMQADCSIFSNNTTDPCWESTTVPFGNYTSSVQMHALLKADVSAIPKDAVVLYAKLSAYVEYVNFTDTIKLQALSRTWDASANWNNPCPAAGCPNWTTPGGDVSSSASYTTPGYSLPSPSQPAWATWHITQLAQDWVHPPAPSSGSGLANNGVLIRRANTTEAGYAYLSSSTSTDTAKRPFFEISYTPRRGLRPSAKFETIELSDRHSANFNAGNGNLMMRAADVSIKGTGIDVAVERFHNSLGAYTGTGWDFSVGHWVDAKDQPDGSVVVAEPGGARYVYIKTSDTPTFATPPGANADLTTSGSTYTLTRHQSGEVFKFGTVPNAGWTGRGFLSEIADRNGNKITLAYNTNHEVTSLTDTQGRSLSFGWTSGLLTSITDWTGRTWSYGYDGSDLVTYTDPDGKVTNYRYDAGGRLNEIYVTSSAGETKARMVYNANGSLQKLSRFKDSSGGTFDWTYAYSSTAQSGGTRCTQYGGSQPAKMLGCTTVTDPRANLTSHGWDEANQVVKAIDAAGNVRSISYGANENVVDYTNSLSAASTLSYDAANPANLTKVLAPSSNGTNTGAATNLSYNAPNPGNGSSLYKYLPSSRTDPQNSCTAFGYDGYGNPNKVTPGITPPTGTTQCDTPPTGSKPYTYAYQGDDAGAVTCNAKPRQLCKATDPNGNVTKYGYDGSTKGNLTSITPPAPLGATTITVDALSRVATVTDGKAQKTTYGYDKFDRVTRVTFNGDTACTSRSTCFDFAYDGNGNLTSRISNIGTTMFTYDKLNQVTKKALPGPLVNACSGQTGMTFTYDPVGNLSTLCDAGGTVTYRYNASNELVSIQEPGGNCAVSPVTGPCTLIGYANSSGVYQDGRRMSVTFPPSTGTVMKMAYDPAGNMTSIAATKGTTTLSSFSYTYAVGTKDTELRRNVTTPAGTTSYGYDVHNRLCYEFAGSSTAACSAPPSGANVWTYDDNGNRKTQVSGGVTTSYAYNGANQLCATSTSGTASCSSPNHTYDANGNQTS